MKRIYALLIASFSVLCLFAQPVSKTFELRYFTNDKKANGVTDFKGETEWMNTDQRIQFLDDYADYASRFFENPNMDKTIVSDEEIKALLKNIKPQPLTNVRQTIPLNKWKAYGYKNGGSEKKENELKRWQTGKGVSIVNGALLLDNSSIEREIGELIWRFKLEGNVMLGDKGACFLELGNGDKTSVSLNIKGNDISTVSAGRVVRMEFESSEWIQLKIEGDFTQKRFNLYLNDRLICDYMPMADTSVMTITKLLIQSENEIKLDDLFIFNHIPGEDAKVPYHSKVVLDENFERKPNVADWQSLDFNDSFWKETDLPAVHGGIREEGESLYLRKRQYIDDFDKAFIQVETLDPGGEIWVNNQVVAVINNRHPQEVEITQYLKKHQSNLIAIRVKPFKLNFPMTHTPSDHHIGWFLGRTKLLLTSRYKIDHVGVVTKSIGENALQSQQICIQNFGHEFFEGTVQINYYPWFPEEGEQIASFSKEIQLRPRIMNEFEFQFPVSNIKLWSPDSPVLYKVEIILKDKGGVQVDDYATTTGIRTIEQKEGDLFVNGKPEMLNGAQIMGFRTPIETISKYHRCAPNETIAEEMLMLKKMGANLLRVHVHAEKDTTDGINDPRYAELADQMGVYLIWSTAAFMREGEAWNVDFEGYPKYIRQVFNHPSIVMWEASNHPNKFKQHGVEETHDFVKRIYQVIYNADSSRLISPTTFWQHTHYGNYDGTIDYKGNPITPAPEFNKKSVTRGNQDAYTGYGNDWSAIRNAPNGWAGSCLKAHEKAYFNFEHEESAGQPNWELCKGKPWYLLHSYEWDYDEGSIGRLLSFNEWKTSQAWQAFSAWESMKKQILLGYDGFSWCCLRGGANMGTYMKPLIDNLRHPKLAYYTNKMVFQHTWAASNNVDIVYGPDDQITPVINHLGGDLKVDLLIQLKNLEGHVLNERRFKRVHLKDGHSITPLQNFRFQNAPKDGLYVIEYSLIVN